MSPASYVSHFLTLSLYLLVALLAAGYAAVLWVGAAIERRRESAHSQPGMVALIIRLRWFWIPSLYALALLFVLMITHTQGAGAAQFMYRRF